MRQYKVLYERDEDGWWVASVRGVKGCHTQGRTIEEARRRIREALGLVVDHAEFAKLIDEVHLPKGVRRELERCAAARERAEAEQEKAQESTKRAARVLTRNLRLSVRDAAELLGLSHQRIQQLT